MAYKTTPKSSWILGTDYAPAGDKTGTLALHLRARRTLFYFGVPCWLRGLLHASGSIGRAYHLLVKGRYTCRTLYWSDQVRQPRRSNALTLSQKRARRSAQNWGFLPKPTPQPVPSDPFEGLS